MAIIRQESVDLGALFNIYVDENIVGTAATTCHEDGLSSSRIVEIGEGHHILIDGRCQLRDVVHHHIGDVRARKQRGIGTHGHHVSLALDGGIDVGKALSEDLRQFILLAVHELHLATVGFEVNDHVVEVAQVHMAIDVNRAAVSSSEFVIVECDDIVVNRETVGSQLERTAITRQIHRGRVGSEIAMHMRVVQRARHSHVAHGIAFEPDVAARDECVGTFQREAVEAGSHIQR